MSGSIEQPRNIDAVIFDWGGTLSRWALVEFGEIWRMAATHLSPYLGEAPDALEQRLAQIELDAWAQMDRDHLAFTLQDLLARASAALRVDVADAIIEEASGHYLDSWLPHIEHDVEAAAMFTALRERGIRTGLLSNTHWPESFHEQMLERDGLLHLIDARVYTSELSYTKPHPEAFRAALEAVGIRDASSAVYVGDRLFDDIHGAQSAGMRAILRPNEHVPSYDVTPDATIVRLSEIVPIIDAWNAG